MDLDDDRFPDSRRVRFEDLDMDQSRRIPRVTFAGEPLTENLCAEYEYERDYVNGEHTPWSEIKIQPRIKHRAGVRSRFSILERGRGHARARGQDQDPSGHAQGRSAHDREAQGRVPDPGRVRQDHGQCQ